MSAYVEDIRGVIDLTVDEYSTLLEFLLETLNES